MGFNSAFKGLNRPRYLLCIQYYHHSLQRKTKVIIIQTACKALFNI